MDVTVRQAKPEEQRELTRLCVRATLHAGHDEAFIERSMPAFTVTVPFIDANYVQVAQDGSGDVVGVAWVTSTSLPGIALLHGLFVEPAHWKRGIGRVLFEAAVVHARKMTNGALMVYSNPRRKDFTSGWEP